MVVGPHLAHGGFRIRGSGSRRDRHDRIADREALVSLLTEFRLRP